ncbi:MAG: T9SS type A sorting domain-containing protein [Flavobacteriales bacterium]
MSSVFKLERDNSELLGNDSNSKLAADYSTELSSKLPAVVNCIGIDTDDDGVCDDDDIDDDNDGILDVHESSCGDGSVTTPFTSISGLGSLASGRYHFDLGQGVFQAEIDNSEGGGWILIGQYIHQGGTNPNTTVIPLGLDLPVLSNSSLGTDGSTVTASWGHASNAFLASLTDADELRFFASTSGHSRILHFKTGVGINYVTTGNGNFTGLASSFELLTGHTGNLPAQQSSVSSDRGDDALTNFPFWRGGVYHWGIRGNGNRWEVDDYPNNFSQSTIHKIWIRSSNLLECSLDSDGDGLLNRLDLDSDGDGCSDAYEAGTTTDESVDFSFSSLDGNDDGLVDEIDVNQDGTVDFTIYPELTVDALSQVCVDTDNDGVSDYLDLDDDNDGILDVVENICITQVSELSWHGAAAANISSSGTILEVTGSTWANAYSDETFELPLKISGVVTGAANGMFGIIPESSAETSGWNDGGFKFEFTNGNGMYVRHGSTNSGWHGPSIVGTEFLLDIDASGNMSYWHNGAVVYTGTVPVTTFKITLSRGWFNMTQLEFITQDLSCADTDGDSTPNSLDPDSDGDGCSDAFEADATGDDSIDYQFSGTDSNQDGLVDALDTDLDGIPDFTSTYASFALESAENACVDTDNDGVRNVDDIDDDNDGILDSEENKCITEVSELTWHGAAAANVSSNGSSLEVTGNPWVNAYSDQTFELPLKISGVVTGAVNGMFGIIPEYSSETTSWNDGGYKFQFNASNGMYVRHGSLVSGWQSPSIVGTEFLLEIDVDGNMRYWHNGVQVYSGTIPITTYKLTLTRGWFNMTDVLFTTVDSACADTDGDSTPNSLDLDSDGDGCSDALESGATLDDTVDYQFSGTDTNQDGLEDALDANLDGIPDFPSSYETVALLSSVNACLDSDNDGVGDTFDIDDDNDGILDSEENKCITEVSELNWHGAAAANVSSSGTSLEVTGDAWANAYSDETFELPLKISGVVTSAVNGMLGILPENSPETTSWNDGGFKFQFNGGNGMYIRHGAYASGWNAPSIIGKEFILEIDAEGSMKYWHNDAVIYTASVPVTTYKITLSRGSFNMSELIFTTQDMSCADTDGDGTPNSLDLDSDGDECSDALESGATLDDTEDFEFSGTDSNLDGLIDLLDLDLDGIPDFESAYTSYALSNEENACIDTDNDGVGDAFDIDDDNDGILDIEEDLCLTEVSELSWHGAAAANVSSTGTTIEVTGYAWANAYSDQTFELPLRISGIVTGAANGMFGIIPESSSETTGWNDGGYKFQFNANNGMYVRHGVEQSGWHSPSLVSREFVLEVDMEGNMSYFNNGVEVYSGSVPLTTYKITLSRGSFQMTELIFITQDASCADTDGDGTSNSLDLDSDGDGCSDAFEASATSDDSSDFQFSGTDSNQDGLVDALDSDLNGVPDFTSTYEGLALQDSENACLDFDNDGVRDAFDDDDDNDGILDEIEDWCVSTASNIHWHGAAAANVSSSESALVVTGNAWANAYSDESFSLPIRISGTITSATNGMMGIIDVNATETSFWNDGAFKFQFNASNGMYVRHGSTISGWHGPSLVGGTFTLEVDETGEMRYYHNSDLKFTGYIPIGEYKLSMSRGPFVMDDFKVSTSNDSCLDQDGDNLPNRLDRDSDGDDCFDAIEAGMPHADVDELGEITGNISTSGVPQSALPGLLFNSDIYDSSVQNENCCDATIAENDCDEDGFTNGEELAGICGLVGDPHDVNSPFKWQETIGSGTNDDQIFQLLEIEEAINIESGETVNLTIKSGHDLVLNSSIVFRNVLVEEGATLDLNGNRLQVKGDLTVNGELVHNLGFIQMNGDCEQCHIYGDNPISIHEIYIDNPHGVLLETDMIASGAIHPEDGVFDLNGNDLTLTSTLVDGDILTGSISEIKSGADVLGDITIQRYVESLEEGYRFIGPPIKNQTVADIDDDLVTTGFTGSNWPNHYFTNIKSYQENQRTDGTMQSGFKDVTSTTQALIDQQGYWAYIPPAADPTLFDATGEFNKGEVTYNLSYTSTGEPSNDGWHCIRNPYPSAIDMESSCITFNNVSQAFYILDHTLGSAWTGEYVVYNNGISVNGGTEVLASFQAIMIQATGPDASITFNECAKTDEQGIFYRSSEEKEYIRLALQREEEYTYETVIAFNENATNEYDPEYDARKLESDLYSLASVVDGELLTINTVSEMNDQLRIPLSVNIPEAGEYKLLVSEIVNVDVNACLFIEDAFTGEMMPINENTTLVFTAEEDNYVEERFILHARSEAEISVSEPLCSGSDVGSVVVALDSEAEATFKWSDASNTVLLEDSGNSSELNGVPVGMYYVQIDNPGSICSSSTFEIEIAPALEEVIEINSTPDYCSSGFASMKVAVENAETFTVEVFKDYEFIANETSETNLLFDELVGGIYDVKVTTDCITEEYVLDLSDPRAVKAKFEAPTELLIENLGAELEIEALSENADEHQWFLDEYFKGEEDVISLTFDEVGSYRLKLNSSNRHCDDTYEQDIMVSAATVITENLKKDFMTINRSSEFSIIRLNDSTERIDVVLYDVQGRKIEERLGVTDKEIHISKQNLSAGVYVLNIMTEDGHLLSTKYAK